MFYKSSPAFTTCQNETVRLLEKPGTAEHRNTEHQNSKIPEHRNSKNS